MVSKDVVWVLIRGLSRSHIHWGNFTTLLIEKYPNSKILCIDLPGNGDYSQLSSPLLISEYTNFVREKLQEKIKIDSKSKINIVSISLGSMIGIDWLMRFPFDINKLILINTSASNFSKFYHRFLIRNYYWVIKSIINNKLSEEKLLAITSNHFEKTKKYLEEFVHFNQNHPQKLKNIIYQLIAASRYKLPEYLKESEKSKIVLFSSQHDRLVSSSCSVAISKKWQIPLTLHPTAGHDLPLDDPQWLLTKL